MANENTFSTHEIASYYAKRVPTLKQTGASWRCPCPVHHGKDNNFSVEPHTGKWYCHSQCQRGGDVFELEILLTGHRFPGAKDEAFRLAGRLEALATTSDQGRWREVARYQYVDESETLLFEMVRREQSGKKNFRLRRPDGRGGWIYKSDGVRLVLYRLPQVLLASSVFVVEGEKCVDALEALGFDATCNPLGAGKWRPEFVEILRGKRVVVLSDNDSAGVAHAARVAESLLGVAESVGIVDLPGLPLRGDIVDWLANGGTADELKALVLGTKALNRERLVDWQRSHAVASDAEISERPNESKETPIATKAEAHGKMSPLATVSGYQILTGDYPPPVFLFENLLHNGVTLLAGRPKIGKSWLALQLAIDAALGRNGLSRFPCGLPTGVLYLALEESESRTHDRVRRFVSRDASFAILTENIEFAYAVEPLLQDGIHQIEHKLKGRRFGLVVIDTLVRSLGGQRRGNRSDAIQEDYEAIKPLQKLAQAYKTSILVVAHTRKMGSEYALDKVAGTTGLTAAADAVWVLDRAARGITLTIQGRDMADAEYAVDFGKNDDAFGWTVVGTGEEAKTSEPRSQILDLLQESDGPMAPQAIAKALSKNPATVRRLLSGMRREGQVSKEGDGYRATR